MTFSALIVDDEPLAIETLRSHFEEDGRVRVVGTAVDGRSALLAAEELKPDAVFLDVGMPGMSGLDLAEGFAAMATPPMVVFVTAFDHFSTQAFDLAVTDYVLKPVEPDRLDRAVDRVSAGLEARARSEKAAPADLWAPSLGTVTRIPIETVKRVEAERDYVRIVTAATTYLLRETMSSIAERLEPHDFLRIHRSIIVAFDDVSGYRHVGAGAWAIVTRDRKYLPIGRSYLETVRQRIGVA